jgi:lycopene cyclase domain-containing protein
VTYAQFHLVFILPVLLLCGVASIRALRSFGPAAPLGILALTVVAVAYTTPWDAYLVREAVWWYGPDRVLATVFGVPVEEYAFFVLQTVLMGLVTILALDRARPLDHVDHEPSDPDPVAALRIRVLGVAVLLLVTGLGIVSLASESTRYLGLILSWSAPILALIWGFGGDRLWNLRWVLAPPVTAVTVYLWVADRFAIADGIWLISERFTVGIAPAGLPVEEALFFLVTNLMVAWGLTLFVLTLARPGREARPPTAHQARHADSPIG